MLAGAAAEPAIEPCAEYEQVEPGHLSNVCSPWPEGDVAYSATIQASLVPQPAAQQVMVYRLDGQWFIRIAGYHWEPGTSVIVTRRNEVPISAEDAAMIAARVDAATLSRLAERPYYGSDLVICTDGASLELAAASNGSRQSARQHSCAGETEMNEISALFRELAIKYDSESAEYLGGL